MIIRATHLKSARRHAQRLGEQIGEALDGNVLDVTDNTVELLLAAWAAFINQFGDPDAGDVVARDYIAEGFRIGVSGVNPHLELVIAGPRV